MKMEEKFHLQLRFSFFLIIANISQGLRITSVSVPGPLVTGEGGMLKCDWDLEQDGLYAVKWYLGLSEFYRWTPAEIPDVKTFPIQGDPILIDLEASKEGKVRIHQVTLDANGVFRCEVSAEAPSFHTESAVALMTVVDLPDLKPQITGAQRSYQMHEDVMLNCSSLNAQPPANLKFYVNNEQADPSWLVPYPAVRTPASKHNPITVVETSVLGLKFPLWPRLLRHGNIHVKCTAEIPNMYYDSSEILIAGDIPHHASIMKDRASTTLASATADVTSSATILWVSSVAVLLWSM